MDSSADGEYIVARATSALQRRWADVGAWMERHHPELFLRSLLATEVTVVALSSSGSDENNG